LEEDIRNKPWEKTPKARAWETDRKEAVKKKKQRDTLREGGEITIQRAGRAD